MRNAVTRRTLTMKTLDNICDQFENDLKELGALTYVFSVSDPDSTDQRWGTGVDMFWILGSLEILKEQIKDDFKEMNKR